MMKIDQPPAGANLPPANRVGDGIAKIANTGVVGINALLGQGLGPVAQGILLRQLDNLANLGKQAAKTVGQWAGQARDALASLPNDAANRLADSMRGSAARALTALEITAVRKAFRNDIDLKNVRIVNGPGRNADAWLAFNVGGNPAITEGNTVYIDDKHYSANLAATPEGINMLVHEFTHVRQYQTMGFGSFLGKYAQDLAAIGDRNKLYDYESRATIFANETIEGQAAMVGDYAGYKAGETTLDLMQVRKLEMRLKGSGIFGL